MSFQSFVLILHDLCWADRRRRIRVHLEIKIARDKTARNIFFLFVCAKKEIMARIGEIQIYHCATIDVRR